ncbi:phosphonate metabolism protein PhnP [Sodalis endosymbiont of Spalangia cameroni]|uniref:phosphonate metabolism protein PhnP n=1 Tax=Sodalis praecaptivus TaxID=1239307 RepID=UPI0031FA283B
MQLTFLGTGDVQQVPVFGCDCAACLRARQRPALRRTATSALIRCDDDLILLDAGQTHLEQRFAPGEITRILLTHYHMDHVQGLFALRWGRGKRIPVYGPPDEQGCDDLYRHPGLLHFEPFLTPFVPLTWGALTLTPVPLIHSKITFGYLIRYRDQQLAYLTDTVGLPDETAEFLQRQPLTMVVLDCSYAPREAMPRNHNDITRALGIHARLRPQRTWLTHISHEVDNWLMRHALPAGVHAATDGLTLTLA